jgi:protein-disulfide isomerase
MTEEQDIPSRNLTRRRILRVVLPSVAVIGIMLGLVAYSLSETPQDEFDQRVHDYLMAHPEVIMESVNRLEARAREKAETDVQKVLQARADEIFRDPDSPTGGNPNGDVTLVEFFDYNCPYCRQVAPVVTKAEQADSQLRVVYKEFPILGPNSMVAAKAALAAHKQGKYVEFHRALYQLRGAIDEGKAMEAAWMSSASRGTWKTPRSRHPSKKISRLPRPFASMARPAS